MKMKVFVFVVSAAIALAGCKTVTNADGTTSKDPNRTAIGAGIGAVAGAGLGALIGKWTGNTALGAGIGAVAGTAAGAIVGSKMDKAKEAARQAGGDVTSITDENGNTIGVKVTLEGDITFDTGKATLKSNTQAALANFAKSLPSDVDVAVIGHTDNTGTDAVNNPLSVSRAKAVESYLVSQGIASSHFKYVEGKGSKEPIADNGTAAGRTKNRRAEIYLLPSATMVNQANQGK